MTRLEMIKLIPLATKLFLLDVRKERREANVSLPEAFRRVGKRYQLKGQYARTRGQR